MNKSLSEMTVQEMKALAYDFARDFERLRNNLQLINQEIAKREEAVGKIEIKEEKKG